MFAVLKTGGKQYRVQSGDVLRVEKLHAEPGETIQFNEVLMIGGDTARVGAPRVEDAAVQATVIDQIKGEKLVHFVKRRRKHSSQRRKGHRQQLTLVRVTEILAEGAGASGVKAAEGARGRTVGAAASASTAGAGAARTKHGGPVADTARQPANLLDAARDGKADDLKKLSGVGPKLEKLLNENGVFHFDQIAEWTADEVAYMDTQLSFKGRIQRENWIEQAKTLAEEKE